MLLGSNLPELTNLELRKTSGRVSRAWLSREFVAELQGKQAACRRRRRDSLQGKKFRNSPLGSREAKIELKLRLARKAGKKKRGKKRKLEGTVTLKGHGNWTRSPATADGQELSPPSREHKEQPRSPQAGWPHYGSRKIMERVLQGHVSEEMQTAWLGQHEHPRDKPCLPNLTAFGQEDWICGQAKSSGCCSLHLQQAFQTVLDGVMVQSMASMSQQCTRTQKVKGTLHRAKQKEA